MSIHNFKPGDKFCKGTFDTSFGEVEIQSDLLLIWKGQFAYPSYRYLKDGKEVNNSERGNDIFGKDFEEVSNKILSICEKKRDNLNKIINKLGN